METEIVYDKCFDAMIEAEEIEAQKAPNLGPNQINLMSNLGFFGAFGDIAAVTVNKL